MTAARQALACFALLLIRQAAVAGQEVPPAGAAVPFHPASPTSLLAFSLIVITVVAAFAWGTFVATRRESGDRAAQRATVRFLVALGVWLGLFSGFVGTGLVETRPLPFVPITLVAVNGVALAYAVSSHGARLARHLPLAALVGFQAFRLPLELVLHAWAAQGTIPVSMTWSGSNLDIVTGIAAVVLAPFANRTAVAWVANVIGLVLLANVARVAMLSSPVPFGWPVEPKLLLVAHLPYAYIAPVCVAGALAGHVILTRRLLGAR